MHDFAAVWDTMIIGLPAASVGLNNDLSVYSQLIRVSITFSAIKNVLVRFLNYFNFTSPTIFCDTSIAFFDEMGQLVRASLSMKNPDLYLATKFVPFESEHVTNENITKLLEYASTTSRG